MDRADTLGALRDIALDHLTLGRAALYAAILERSAALSPPQTTNAATSTTARLKTRSAKPPAANWTPPWTASAAPAQQHYLPHGLLTRAWLRFLTGARTGPESAQEDLDEAWEIAERGPMKLFMADIHLHRARLFREKAALVDVLKTHRAMQLLA